MNKALIRYLENRFVEIAKDCGRYSILTKNTYKNTVLKEAQIATMKEFIDNVKILINTLGYKVLVPVPKAADDTVYLYCKGTEASAKGFVSTGGFTVLSGSKYQTIQCRHWRPRVKVIIICEIHLSKMK